MAKPVQNRDEILIEIKKMLKNGCGSSEIHSHILDNYKLSKQNLVFLVGQARENLKKEIDFNIRDIMIKHTSRYEAIYRKNRLNPYSKILENPDDDLEDEDVRKTLFKVANHYMTAAKALQAKERMLGLVHNRMDVQLKNELAESEEDNSPALDAPSLDLSKLTLEEKKEILFLLKKAKGEIEEEKTKVTTTVTVTKDQREDVAKYEEVVSKFETEDVEYEEVYDDQSHVVKKFHELHESEAKQLDEKIKSDKRADEKLRIKRNKAKLLEKFKKK